MGVGRDSARFACSVAVRVRCPSWADYLELHATNISKGGVFVASDVVAKIGAEVTVELTIPTGATIELDAQVVHHQGPVPGMGLMFLEMDPKVRKAMDAMVTVAQFTLEAQSKKKPEPVKMTAAPRAPSGPRRAVPAPPTPEPREPMFADVVEQTLLNELARRMELTPHQQLDVEPEASPDEIDLTYFRLCEKYHPVIFERYTESTKTLVTQINDLIRNAWEQLSGAVEVDSAK